MDEPAWWPSGIANSSVEDAISEGYVRTSFGKSKLWDISLAESSEWWNTVPIEGTVWGEWPSKVNSVEVISHRPNEMIVRLNNSILAILAPLECGDDVSRLVRHEPWRVALKDAPVLLPTGGWSVDENDRVLVFPWHDSVEFSGQDTEANVLMQHLAEIHSCFAFTATPNTERRWNDRLKALEDQLKTNTMWRAPHSPTTVGLPQIHLSATSLVDINGRLNFLPLNRSFAQHMLCEADRLPSISGAMMLEHQLARNNGLNEDQRRSMLETWASHVPQAWSNRAALSTVRGGAWVWRYHATLLEMAQAKAFNDEQTYGECLAWLQDVSRLQAHLGALRMWKSGTWVGLSAAVVAFFAWRLETMTSNQSALLAVISLGTIVASNAIYRMKDPPPY